ncbi:MAG: hypothetical protein COV43_04410 [Deltaproteobacteria bacterium CG11_big_fil_rev_8_21_14_0_20_42_23]|nr:MAG: hypothetical protein COV43_04410 [Deltaproteobacteria bacterium CG11_big_fil_rev_8_21_14_0_20_42_23]PJC65017.1 MAG: hypothetical protein CO021_00800 [Deltaproteobacteria bacterium CG_4_9_14_0_2_um_filter_42_21]
MSSAKARIFLDVDGAVPNKTSALYYDVSIQSDSSLILQNLCIPLDINGTLMVRSDITSALAFHAFGVEYLQQDMEDGREFLQIGQVLPTGGPFIPFDITGTLNGSNPLDPNYKYFIENFFICNTSPENAEGSYYYDSDGNVLDDNSIIDTYVPVFKNQTINLNRQNFPIDSNGAFAVFSGVDASINFSIFGYRKPKRSF